MINPDFSTFKKQVCSNANLSNNSYVDIQTAITSEKNEIIKKKQFNFYPIEHYQNLFKLNLMLSILYFEKENYLASKKYLEITINLNSKHELNEIKNYSPIINYLLKAYNKNDYNNLQNFFSKMELVVIHSLLQSKVQKTDLITQLFGNDISYLTAENRFKNLMIRLNKKYPKLIKYFDGHYSIDKINLKLIAQD